jgi:hypothetical protein
MFSKCWCGHRFRLCFQIKYVFTGIDSWNFVIKTECRTPHSEKNIKEQFTFTAEERFAFTARERFSVGVEQRFAFGAREIFAFGSGEKFAFEEEEQLCCHSRRKFASVVEESFILGAGKRMPSNFTPPPTSQHGQALSLL